MPELPIADTPITVNLANDLPGLIEAAAVNLEDNWKTIDGPAPRQLPIIIGHAQATLALAIAQADANRIAETDSLINYLAVASQHRLAYQPGEGVLKSIQARVEERLGLA